MRRKSRTHNTRFAIVGFKTEFKDGLVLEKLVNNRKIRLAHPHHRKSAGTLQSTLKKRHI